MTLLEDSSIEAGLPLAGPSIIDGQPTRAPVIVTQQGDQVAIWQVDLAGSPCGAWVLPGEGVNAALRLLSICDRRGLITIDPKRAVGLLLRLAKVGGISIDREALESRLCLLSSLVEETRDARGTYIAAVRDLEVRGGKRLSPLVWERPVPEPVPQTLDQWATAPQLPRADDQSVGEEALQLARLARYALGLWIDTEGRRVRRKYLREEFGPSQPLPPSWRRAVVSAYGSPFDPGSQPKAELTWRWRNRSVATSKTGGSPATARPVVAVGQ